MRLILKQTSRFVLILTLGLYALSAYSFVYAIEGCADEDTTCFDQKILEYQAKIAQLKSDQKNLESTLSLLDSEVSLKSNEIRKTNAEILKLEKEIAGLSNRIQGLEISLEKLTTVLVDRIQASYKSSKTQSSVQVVVLDAFADLVTQYKFTQLSRDYLRALVAEAELQRLNYDEEKIIKEDKQLEIERLKKSLESQRATLEQQQKQKKSLLESTQNDERKFQNLLSQALAEKNALEAALVSGTRVGPVKKGDAIALVGNTGYPGCSTGEHLHFEIRKNNVWVDPSNYLQSKQLKDEQNGGFVTLGSGSWDWPLQDTIRLTQHYGVTPYSWRYKYSGGVHTGLDLVSMTSKIIRAPADGELFSATESCGSNSSPIKIVFIDHGESVQSFYLHVQ